MLYTTYHYILGYLGCSVDVMDTLDYECSGKDICIYPVINIDVEGRTPCKQELRSYLEVDYVCLKGTHHNFHLKFTDIPFID